MFLPTSSQAVPLLASVAGFVGSMAVLLLLASTPLFRAADAPPTAAAQRLKALDGLRGFLALSVVFYHIAVYRQKLLFGEWLPPDDNFSRQLGPLGVSLFFMITAYLFWGRLLRRAGQVPWVPLYLGRLFRIAPLYLLAFAVVVLTTAVKTGWHPQIPVPELLVELSHWAALGSFKVLQLNGWPDASMVLAGVTWTLQYEWFFYVSLPAAAVFARRRSLHLVVPIFALVALLVLKHVIHRGQWPLRFDLIALFACGMLCASLKQMQKLPQLPDWASSTLVVLCCSLGFLRWNVYTTSQLLELLVAFYLITSGCSVFGLLHTRPARRLGDISYGIYLLQGIPLYLLYHAAPFRQFASTGYWNHWAVGLLACVLLLGLALLAHVAVELPGMALGRRVIRRWEATA